MKGPLRFSNEKDKSQCNRGRGLIQLYILHSLKNEQKSGYDLIKEIANKTNDSWVPSKGTLYPMLTRMNEEGLIAVSETGKRSRKRYQLTDTGRKTLQNIITDRKAEKEKMYVFSDLLFEIFREGSDPLMADSMKIHLIAGKIKPEKKNDAHTLIIRCLSELERLDSYECSNRE
ncbi:MAG: PadR family transcriptional regulator [Methanospirillaceae archaeon]|nr:PadR family transcriptional regulator [Methanospirillaceae archaeon]